MEKVQEYRLLDSGNCRKLEQAGPYKIIRPALNAFWKPVLPQSEWDSADAEFHRESTGGGVWNWKKKHAEEWLVSWGGLLRTGTGCVTASAKPPERAARSICSPIPAAQPSRWRKPERRPVISTLPKASSNGRKRIKISIRRRRIASAGFATML